MMTVDLLVNIWLPSCRLSPCRHSFWKRSSSLPRPLSHELVAQPDDEHYNWWSGLRCFHLDEKEKRKKWTFVKRRRRRSQEGFSWQNAKFVSSGIAFGPAPLNWDAVQLANCPAAFLSYFHCGFVMKYSRRWEPSIRLSKMFEPFLWLEMTNLRAVFG